MPSLADRLHQAMQRRAAEDPTANQAGLARFVKAAGPSVSNWFTGETKSLKADSLIRAAEYLRVRPRWLLDGTGPMTENDVQAASRGLPPTPATPDLATGLPVFLDALRDLPAARWPSVRAQLDQLVSHPEMRDDVLAELRLLLQPAAGKQSRAA